MSRSYAASRRGALGGALWCTLGALAPATVFANPEAQAAAPFEQPGLTGESPSSEQVAQAPAIVGETEGGASPDDVIAGAEPAISALELQQLALVNGARLGRGLPALEWDHAMASAARAHAADMMLHNRISHTGSDGSTPNQRLRRAGVVFRFGSENIWTYWGKVPDEGPSTMHAAMMAEPHAPGLWNHIGNILYPGYKRIGIGIVVAPSGVQYLSEKFAD